MQRLYFDIESTGIDPQKDQIVELAIIVEDEDGNVIVNKAKRYKPDVKISKEAQDTHGIKMSDVKDCPSFKSDAKKLKKMFEDKIIIGQNIMRFDLPLLLAEFERAGVEIELSGKYIDTLTIEKKLNVNTLEVMYRRYTGEKLEGAHGGLADVSAVRTILPYQLEAIKMKEYPKDIDEILENDVYKYSNTNDLTDLYGKFRKDKAGNLVFKFGKHKDLALLENKDTRNYADWMLSQNFPNMVKKMIRAELAKDVKAAFKKNPEDSPAKAAFRESFNEGLQAAAKRDQKGENPWSFADDTADGATDDDLPF